MNNEERNILYSENVIPSALEIAKNHDFNPQFNKKMLKKIDKWDDKISDEERNKRVDLTGELFVTIDGKDTKDFDDAICVEKMSHGTFRVLVSIADVAHFVKEDSLLDQDALKRGTSLYLINTVLPMLPRKLSNDLCSLMPQKERLTLTVEMVVNKQGEVIKNKIYESVIKSKSKLTYENINSFIKGEADLIVDEVIEGTEEQWRIEQMVQECIQLQKILQTKRVRRGTLDFAFEESSIELDENHKPISIKPYNRGVGNRIIEELMILTNEVVAKRFYDMGVPFLYRIHEHPKEESIGEVYNFIGELDYTLPRTLSTKDIQKILDQARGQKEEETVNLLLLQAMKKAKYYHEEVGHFGLGCQYYSHFTSPIRRYPDLFIHRVIKSWLHKTLSSSRIKELKPKAEMVGRISSIQERKAQDAEIYYDNVKKIEYAYDNLIGKEFDGVVIGINDKRLEVKLPNTITGVLSLSNMGNYEIVTPRICIQNMDTEEQIVIGDKVKVKVGQVYIVEQIVVLEKVEEKE